MSSNLMDTEIGGEQTQYEGARTENVPHKKSGGQLGEASTTEDPAKADGAEEQRAERGEKTAENIRYGQAISEGGMSGFTAGQSESGATQGGYGRVEDQSEGAGESEKQRRAAGYGGDEDMDREIGA